MGGGGLYDFSVSQSPSPFDFDLTLDMDLDFRLTILFDYTLHSAHSVKGKKEIGFQIGVKEWRALMYS